MANRSGCVCETEKGQVVELCCAHEEFYKALLQVNLSKLREVFEKAVKELLEEDKP